MNVDLIRAKVIKHLERVRPRGRPVVPISDDTELWYDLCIYGDELWDFQLWAQSEFGIEPNFPLRECAPGEVMLPFMRRRHPKKSDPSRFRYRSLTVRDVVTAAQTGRWFLTP